jgi:hypothetical protein
MSHTTKLKALPAHTQKRIHLTDAQKAADTLLKLITDDSDLSDGVMKTLGADNTQRFVDYLKPIQLGKAHWGNSSLAPLLNFGSRIFFQWTFPNK